MTRVNNGLDHWTLGLYFELFFGPFPWTFFLDQFLDHFKGWGGGGQTSSAWGREGPEIP